MNKIRWGVLSTAQIARTQVIPAIHGAEQAEVIAIAGRSNRVHTVAAELTVSKAYEGYDSLLSDPEIDAVYIPLPNHMHKEWTIKAARQGKHVLVEKPAALTAADAAEMVQVCRTQGVKFMEAFMYRLHPQYNRAKDIIASGEIGEIKLLKASHSFHLADRQQNIRMGQDTGGGSLYDVGCYCISAIRHMLEAEPERVQMFAETDSGTGVDITAVGYMEFPDGVKAVFDCSFDMAHRQEVEVIGTKGSIKMPFAFRPDTNANCGIIAVTVNGQIREEKVDGDVFSLEIEHFTKVILQDGQPEVSGENTVRNMAVIDACRRSIATGQPEPIEPL